MAQPFDADGLELRGEAVPVAENVLVGGPTGAAGPFSVSENGILAYQTGAADSPTQLTWFDRAGKPLGVLAETGSRGELSLSPDGSRLAVTEFDPSRPNTDVWFYDIARRLRMRYTSDAASEGGAVWSPDGQRVAFAANRKSAADYDLYVKPASEPGSEELLFAGPQTESPESWSPDGRFIAFTNQRSFLGVTPTGSPRSLGAPAGRRSKAIPVPSDTVRGDASPLFSRRAMDRIRVERNPTERGVRRAVPWPWKQGADLDGRWKRTAVAARRQ